MTLKHRVAVLDDSQHVGRVSADWSQLNGKADVEFFHDPFASEDDAAKQLKDFDILVPMRERTAFSASLIEKLPQLGMIALTGARAPTLDLAACAANNIMVCNTGGDHVGAATAELTWALVMACARDLPHADATMRRGGWHGDVRMGIPLAGKRMGIVGLGKLGRRVAGYAQAFGMEVAAWSQNLTEAAAADAGAQLVSKEELFATSDVVSLHLVLSGRTRHIVGPDEIAAMKHNAILVNTSRGPLIDMPPLVARLQNATLLAGLDVYDQEPLPKFLTKASSDHRGSGHDVDLRSLRNVVLTPHLGYSTDAVFRQFYQQSIENVLAFIDGHPIRMLQQT